MFVKKLMQSRVKELSQVSRRGTLGKKQGSLVAKHFSVNSSQLAAGYNLALPGGLGDYDNEIDSRVVRDEMIISDEARDQVLRGPYNYPVYGMSLTMCRKWDDLIKTIIV
jgi:hypothetical protein